MSSAGGDQMALESDDHGPSAPLLPVHDSFQRSASFRPPPGSLIFTANNLFILLGPLSAAVICLCARQLQGWNMLAVLVWVFVWWVTEAVSMPITSMAPLFLFPVFGIASADDVARSYMDDVISLVLGSFILGLAVEHYNIQRRLALNITLLFCGDPLRPRLLLLGICATSAFVSMWVHNVAAAVMMMPVATGILQRMPSGAERTATVDKFSRGVVLGVIYAVAIGGMSTVTGTGVNLILVGLWKTYFPEAQPITFNTWFMFAFPTALFILILLWAILCCLYCPPGSGPALSPYLHKAHLRRELQLLGPVAFAEKIVLAVFSILILLWMTRSITDDIPGWGVLFDGRVGDGTVSVMMATFLFIIPNKKNKGEKLMDWNKCKKLPWNIILLLGAGLAIADGVRSSGLADVLSETLNFLVAVPRWAVVPSVCLVSGAMTEFISSNNATTLLLIPLLVQIAHTIRVNPLLLMIPGAVGAQFAFLLPTATPSNTVGFSTGHIGVEDMIKTGLLLKVAAIAVLSLSMPTLGDYVFGTSKPITS